MRCNLFPFGARELRNVIAIGIRSTSRLQMQIRGNHRERSRSWGNEYGVEERYGIRRVAREISRRPLGCAGSYSARFSTCRADGEINFSAGGASRRNVHSDVRVYPVRTLHGPGRCAGGCRPSGFVPGLAPIPVDHRADITFAGRELMQPRSGLTNEPDSQTMSANVAGWNG